MEKQDLKDYKEEAFSLIEEFKKFAFKGSIVDLSVGMIIGSSFSKIVSSLVDNIFMPIISILFPNEKNYRDWHVFLYEKKIPFGIFLSDLITFLIVSIVLFVVIKKILILFKKEEKKQEIKKKNIQEEALLEIRDILKSQFFLDEIRTE